MTEQQANDIIFALQKISTGLQDLTAIARTLDQQSLKENTDYDATVNGVPMQGIRMWSKK